MHARRSLSIGALVAVSALLFAPLTAATAAELPTQRAIDRPGAPVPVDPARMIDVDPADYAEAGAALPAELRQSLARDVGLTGAEWLAQSEAANSAADVVADLTEAIEVVDARLEGYDLVVTVETETDARLARSVGALVEFGAASESRIADTIEGLEPAADLRGGMPYRFDDFRCSIGFVGIDTTTDQLQTISAGHCEGTSGSPRSATTINRPTISGGVAGTPLTTIGNAGLHVTDEYPNPGFDTGSPDFDPVSTYYDLGMTPATNDTWVGKPEIVTWGNSTSGAPLASTPLTIRDAGPAIAGSTLCKSGSTTGWTCGPITLVDEIQYVGTGVATCPAVAEGDYCLGSIQANVCVRGGDSGGAAVVGSRAVGITSAATNSLSPTCSASVGTPNIGVFATLYSANPAWEQVTKVYPDWEPLIGVNAPKLGGTASRVDPSASSISGMLTSGSVRHTVSVSLNGGVASTRPVGSTGTWTAPTAGLPLGALTWQARGLWGEGSQSSLASGDLLRADEDRLFGSGRFATAQEIAKAAFPTPGVDVVYIANGLNFPDALAAGPAAFSLGGPLLLTLTDSLPAETVAELNRLQPARIVIVGSPVVVSTAVEQQLAANWAGGNVERVGGASRYETGRLIVRDAFVDNAVQVDEVYVATGANYADALSAGAAAAAKGVPIVLVQGTEASIDDDTRALLEQLLLPNATVYIAGGSNVVSAGIASSIDSITQVTSVQRLSGTSRFTTSLAINANAYPAAGPDVDEAFIAYGLNFPDALAGGVLAGVRQGPLYITLQNCVESGMVDHMIDIGIEKVTLFGSASVITNNVRDLVRCT